MGISAFQHVCLRLGFHSMNVKTVAFVCVFEKDLFSFIVLFCWRLREDSGMLEFFVVCVVMERSNYFTCLIFQCYLAK